jgi:hypothetical protein
MKKRILLHYPHLLRQKPASFNLDQVMNDLTEGDAGKRYVDQC